MQDEMVRWHHWLKGHKFEQTLRDSEGQGSLVCCSPWGSQIVGHDLATENNNNKTIALIYWRHTSKFSEEAHPFFESGLVNLVRNRNDIFFSFILFENLWSSEQINCVNHRGVLSYRADTILSRVCVCVCVHARTCTRTRMRTHTCAHAHTQFLSVVSDSMISWTIALEAPLSMGFSKQEYWGGLPFPSPGNLLNPGIKSTSPVSCIDRWIFYQWAT